MRLINQLHPVPLESLASLLERLRQANYYEEASWFRSLIPPSHGQHANLLRAATNYRLLAELTGLAIEQLQMLTLHRFVPFYYPPEALPHLPQEYDDLPTPMWEPRALELYVHGQQYWKVCPLCWKQHHAVLLPWSLRHVTTCASHRVLLVDHCRACGTPLRVNMAAGSCAACGEDIGRFVALPLDGHESSLVLTELVWSAAGCEAGVSPPGSLPVSPQHPLHQMSRTTLLHFLWRFGQLLVRHDPHNPLFDAAQSLFGAPWAAPPTFMRTTPVKDVHCVLVAVLTLLLNWPDALHMTFERIVAQERQETKIHARFPYILAEEFVGSAWAWFHQGWIDFMQQRVGHSSLVYPWLRYYRTAQRSAEADIPPLLSQREAARLLHVGERSLRRSLDKAELQATVRPRRGSRREWQLIGAESVQQLQAWRASFLTLAQTATYCGTSEDQVVALVAAGMLQADHGPLHDSIPTWSFAQDVPRQFLAKCLDHLPTLPPSPADNTQLSLSQALRVLSPAGERLPGLLRAVQQGSLAAYHQPEAVGLQGLWFERSDVSARLEQVQQAKEHSTYTVEEVCALLHCKPPALRRWHRTGLLIPCKVENGPAGTRMWYAIQDVVVFRERYITTDRAAELLCCTPLTTQHWAKAGRIAAVTGPDIDGSHAYRFDREALVQWRYERLTVGEAATLLGVSVSTIDRWAREGSIEPLPDMGGKQRWFAREALLRCRSQKAAQPF
jgi:excisionase family DNA binding protein